MITFYEYLNSSSVAPGAMIPADSIGNQAAEILVGRPPFLSDTVVALNDLKFDIPKVTKIGKITKIFEKQNPIKIVINNKTFIYQTKSQYDKIKYKIKPNCLVKIVFQRMPDDFSTNLSQIHSIEFLDQMPKDFK